MAESIAILSHRNNPGGSVIAEITRHNNTSLAVERVAAQRAPHGGVQCLTKLIPWKEPKMGITIFVRGTIDRIEDIPDLIDELRGIAQEHNWSYHIIDDDFDMQPNAVLMQREPHDSAATIEGSLGLKGIILNVDPKAEPLSILFDRHGVLTDIMQQLSWIDSNGQDERFTICKTQFGGIESHIRIINLLDRLKTKYISNLAVTDEGDFWETRDPRILAEKRVALGHYLRHAERVIGSIEISSDDVQDAETIASRIETALLKAEKEDGALPYHQTPKTNRRGK